MRSSDAYAAAITGRNAGVALISATCLFSNPNRAESDLQDVENALLHTREVHANVEKNYSDENILTYELTVYEESEMYTQPSLIAALTRQVGSRDT